MLSRRRFLAITGGTLAAGAAGVAGYGLLLEPRRLHATSHRTALGVPRFAQLSDLHLRRIGAVHEQIAQKLAAREAAFLVITGDSVDRARDLPLLRDFLALLPDIPKFATLGNWEHWAKVDLQQLRAVYERANTRLLVNESASVAGLEVIGLDSSVGGRPDIRRALSTTAGGHYRLVLAHCPVQRDELPRDAALNLVLSGHTHGGQVAPFGVAPFRPLGSGRYVAGWYHGGVPMYVSRGVGMSVLPVRLGARPEIAFFEGVV